MEIDDIVLDPSTNRVCDTPIVPSEVVLITAPRIRCCVSKPPVATHTGVGCSRRTSGPIPPSAVGWTHIVRRPATFRCRITDPQAAAELYRSVWRYASVGMSVPRVRINNIPARIHGATIVTGAHRSHILLATVQPTRCSLALRFEATQLLTNAESECQVLRQAVLRTGFWKICCLLTFFQCPDWDLWRPCVVFWR